MKKAIRTAAVLLACIFSFNACGDEDALSPSGNYSPIRGGFPQGDTEYDSIINEIKNTNVPLITKSLFLSVYKDNP